MKKDLQMPQHLFAKEQVQGSVVSQKAVMDLYMWPLQWNSGKMENLRLMHTQAEVVQLPREQLILKSWE